jgi:hypothetical protein
VVAVHLFLIYDGSVLLLRRALDNYQRGIWFDSYGWEQQGMYDTSQLDSSIQKEVLSMLAVASRYLYLARHGEAVPDESGLSDAGRQQAILLGQRLRARPITAVYRGPLPRALQTARLVADQLDGVSLTSSVAAGDYVPYMPERISSLGSTRRAA